MQTLILMQGAPGSGKSTLARQLARRHAPAKICSTDDFQVQEDGVYRFDPLNLAYYHAWNQFEAAHWMREGYSVVIDNCNIKRAHAEPYVAAARRMGVFVQVVRCTGEYQSVHGVPPDVVARMRAEREDLLR